MANVVVVADQDQVGDDVMVKVEEMMEKLKAKSLFLHGELVAKKVAHARALINKICLQRDSKKTVEENEGTARQLAAEITKRENSAVVG